MALIPPFFFDCVVAIGYTTANGTVQYGATGFLYGRLLGGEGNDRNYRIFLITKRHVLEDAQEVALRFNPERDEPARGYLLHLLDDNEKRIWSAHPDPEVDVAALGINAQLLQREGIRFNRFRSDEHVADRAKALELGIAEGDGVFVLGFPMGIVGEARNFVIVRQGAIARIRYTLTGSAKQFLIDTFIFPGNSGGPAVCRPEIVCIEGTKAVSRPWLLGIVSGYIPYMDVAVSEQTRRPRVTFEENSGLAAVIPADYVNEITHAATAPSEDRTHTSAVEVTPGEPPGPSAQQ